MNKKSIVFISILMLLEIVVYYVFGASWNLYLKLLPSIFLFFFYFQHVKGNLQLIDKFLLCALVANILGEIAYVFKDNELVFLFILLFYLIEHQLYIIILRKQNGINQSLINESFVKKGWPYLAISFLFFGLILMNNVPDIYFALIILYVVQFAVLGAISLQLRNQLPGKLFIIIGVAVNALSDSLTSWEMFVFPFTGDYVLIRITYVSAKYLIAYGIYQNRNLLVATVEEED